MSEQGAPTTPPVMNNISDRQNTEHFLRLLRARSRTYAVAQGLQVVQLVLVVLLPVAGAIVGLIWPGVRSYVAFIALVIAALDTVWLDRWQRRKLKAAAKICEEFDCELLELPWNRLAAGRRVDPELIEAAALAWNHGDGKLLDWYPKEICTARMPLARVMCQRTNAWYDGQLRQRYGVFLLAFVCVVFIAMLVAGLVLKLSLLDLTATVLTPAAPALIWCLREHFRQRDIAELSETSKSEADTLCERAAVAGVDEAELLASARELQNVIYYRRASSPLLLPFVYRLVRPRMERHMRAGVASLLNKFR